MTRITKLALLLIALMIAAAPIAAAEDGNSAAPEMCKFFHESAPEVFDYFYSSLGDCVSYLTDRQDDVAHWCQLDYFRDFFGYDSVGECVGTLRT